jgi:glycosyltransferase involved in cell wall biosynthesis
MTCKLSLVIPSYNSERTIAGTLASILKILPEMNVTEILLIDGGSNDSTVSIVEDSNLPIRIYSEPDRGIYDAMNKGIALSKGQWIFFLGSDDFLLPDFSKAVNELQDPDRSYYGDVLLARDNVLYCGKFNTLKLQLKNICHQSIFYSKSALIDMPFNNEFTLLADYELNLRLWSRNKNHFQYLQFAVCRYNNETGASTSKRDVDFANKKKSLILEYFGLLSFLVYAVSAAFVKILLLFSFFKRRWRRV